MFMGLDKDRYDRQYSDRYLYQRLWAYFKPQLRPLLILTGMGLLVSVMLAVQPIIISDGIEALEDDAANSALMLLVGALFISTVIQYFGNWVRRRLTNRVVGTLMADLRKDAFKAAIERDMAFYDENKTGKILSRITSDTEDFGQTVLFGTDLLSQLVQVLILFVVLVSYDALLTAILVLSIIPVAGITLGFRTVARKATRQGSRAMAEVNDNIQETVTGISVAKNFRQEALVYEAFNRVNSQSYRVNLRRGLVLASIFPILNGFAGFAFAAVVYAGADSVLDGAIGLGIWYLYIQAVDRFWFPIINISAYFNQFQQAMSSLERIFALIDAENTVKQTGNEAIPDLHGHIVFDNVNFQYKSGEPVLENFRLDIKAGESVAFVGHTGAGKSTIAKLIMRLYEFQGGKIEVDGHDIRNLDLHDYRGHIGFVPQMPFLFAGTVMDNIRYGRPNASDEEVREIAYSIGGGEWIETLPNGLESNVGERGSRLSIGQRQLVSLLRVLVQKPAVFILDEATASIDPFTEMQIQEALENILSQSTSILIAHRLSTVRSADRIIVLSKGRRIEEGSHEELMAQGGHYAELYNTYFRHQSLSYVEDSRKLLLEDLDLDELPAAQDISSSAD